MLDQDSKNWNTIIKSYSIDAKHHEALSLYVQKSKCPIPIKPDHLLLSALLKSCAAVSAINLGKSFHGSVIKIGQLCCQCVSKAVLNMYAKCGALDDCKKLFGEMKNIYGGDPVAWNIVLSGFSGSGVYEGEVIKMFSEMIKNDTSKPNAISVAIVLPICARLRDLSTGKSVHSYVIKSGLESQTIVGNALISLYAKCGAVQDDANAAFQGMEHKDVVSWNAMIAGLAENNSCKVAFELFCQMSKSSIKPNSATIANILPVCASSLNKNVSYSFGKEIHCYVLRRSLLIGDISVSNALISFYLRIGRVEKVEILFRKMQIRDLVSWNAIIAGHASNGKYLRALELFRELLCVKMVEPDFVTLVSVFPACAQLRKLKAGKEIHGYTLRNPYLCDITAIGNALISFYAKCEAMDAAFNSFLMIYKKDLISWNSMLDAFAYSGYETQFIDLLHWMIREGYKSDSITILTIIHFSANASRVEKVKETHCYSLKASFLQVNNEPTIENAILDAYSKCGEMGYACKIFECLSEKRNIVTCNAMISGYVYCGLHDDAYMLFNQMPQTDLTTWNLMIRVYAENDHPAHALSFLLDLQDQGMKPDAMSIMSILPVSAQMASVRILKQCHAYVVRSCFDDVRLKGAMLDLYSKCGNVSTALRIFLESPEKDLVMFTAMIGGYAMHGMGEESLKIFKHMLELNLKPDHVILTSVLSACSHSGLLNEGWTIFDSIEKVHGIKPTMKQYACAVDLLARRGRVKDAYAFVNKMPIQANANVWGTLLGACKTYHEVELGRDVANRLFEIESENIGNYVVMSNIYAADCKWDKVMEIRRLMRTRDLKKPAGCSSIEVESRKNTFIAGDSSHPQRSIIYDTLCILDQQIKEPLDLQLNSLG